MSTPSDSSKREATSSGASSQLQNLPAHDNSLHEPRPSHGQHTVSAPSPVQHFQSPLRHHYKSPSTPRREIKETLNARSEYSNSEDDGAAEHRINQYLIKQEIGRGSFGAVHLAVDQFGQEYAVKEFSKSRLKKRAQSNMLRRNYQARRPGQFNARRGFNSPLHFQGGSASDSTGSNNSLELIREEIAIMKKLHHPNVVSLIEVLDDPNEDSLYMVLEMCKKGVVMKVGLDELADPYDEQRCRLWFRDMILGIEYLHAHGICHRDIKPDNCLVTDDDVLKIVDFGVSEMFDKGSEMTTTKSAGSPAFMPPELCVAKHGEVSGRAADIWSMGVTLYCLKFGHIPFEKTGMLDLYEAIKKDDVKIGPDCSSDLKDLLLRLLEKEPQKRITMDEIRDHPWVTLQGADKLLSREDNISVLVEPPTEEEVNAAITAPIRHLFVVMKAAKQFKKLLKNSPELLNGIFGKSSRIVQPPLPMSPSPPVRAQSVNIDNRERVETALASEGVHRNIENLEDLEQVDDGVMASRSDLSHSVSHPPKPSKWKWIKPTSPSPLQNQTIEDNSAPLSRQETGKGQAHDPLEDTLYLSIGTSSDSPPLELGEQQAVSESPGAVDFNVYEKAYEAECQRILQKQEGVHPTIYLTRRVESNKVIRESAFITDHDRRSGPSSGFSSLMKMVKSHAGTKSADKSGASCDDKPGVKDAQA